MLNRFERKAVKIVSKLAPWFAPVPSAYFVGRSSVRHLDLPIWVAVIIASVIETLGVVTVHNLLWMNGWNATRRKSDPAAPAWIAVILCAIYLATTVSITLFLETIPLLETIPPLATYAPVMFPFLALVGGVNISLMAQQEKREMDVEQARSERAAVRSAKRSAVDTGGVQVVSTTVNTEQQVDNTGQVGEPSREHRQRVRREALLDILREHNGTPPSVTELAARVGPSCNTVYKDLNALESRGLMQRRLGSDTPLNGEG